MVEIMNKNKDKYIPVVYFEEIKEYKEERILEYGSKSCS